MKIHLAALSLALSPLLTVQAAEDPPADLSLARDQAKSVSEAVKHDAKVVADAAKGGEKHVAATAKAAAHEVAAASKAGGPRGVARSQWGAGNDHVRRRGLRTQQ